jgi:acyl-ACP thioesterase
LRCAKQTRDLSNDSPISGNAFVKTFSIPYYGLDIKNSLKSGTLLEFFQEAASQHAQSVGIGVSDMQRRGATWVLRRYRVNIRRRAGLGNIAVRTWYEPKRNLMSVRLFEALDESGAVIADAWSGWIAVDLERGKPVRLDRVLPAGYYDNAGSVEQGEIEDIERIVAGGADNSPRASRGFRVRLRELDLNGHTNHTVYFDWAIETVPDEISLNFTPTRLDAEFLASVPRTDVTVNCHKISDSPIRFAHSVTRNDSGQVSALLATEWG